MATMTMNKVIHGAFRRDLDRLFDATGRFTDGDGSRAAALGTAWDNFHAQLHHHHHGEHEIAWPAMLALGLDQETLDVMDAEHAAMAAALDDADAAMSVFSAAATTATAEQARTAIAHLQTVAETHLQHEESLSEKLMLDNAENPVIKAMGKKFSRSMSIAESGTFFAWLSDGATPAELEAMTNEIPKPVVTIIGGLFGRGYRRTIAPTWR